MDPAAFSDSCTICTQKIYNWTLVLFGSRTICTQKIHNWTLVLSGSYTICIQKIYNWTLVSFSALAQYKSDTLVMNMP